MSAFYNLTLFCYYSGFLSLGSLSTLGWEEDCVPLLKIYFGYAEHGGAVER